MSTLAVVKEILRETKVPMSVRQIVEYADGRLPTRSKTPDTVVARDLSMDMKKKGDASLFIRTAPGRYTVREIHEQNLADDEAADKLSQQQSNESSSAESEASVLASTIRNERAGTLPARSSTASAGGQRTGTD